MPPEPFSVDPLLAEARRLRSEAARRIQRVRARLFRRATMRRLFEHDGALTPDAQIFVGLMADAAELGAIKMADDGRAETWRAGRQALVREMMSWFDVSEEDLMQLRSDAAKLEENGS